MPRRRAATRGDRADMGTAERRQHGPVMLRETIQAGVVGAHDPEPLWLDRYAARGAIAEAQLSAGLKLMATISASGVRTPVTQRFQAGDGAGGEMSDGEAEAHAQWVRIMRAAPRPCAADVQAVCLYDFPAGDAARLREGLRAVAVFLGLTRR